MPNAAHPENIFPQALHVSRGQRELIKGHTGKVIWFTGLSGSGKSTLANALEQALHSAGKHTYILDGDNIRSGLCSDLGFSDADRVENIRRIAEVARLMMDAGLISNMTGINSVYESPETAEQTVDTSEAHATEALVTKIKQHIL